MSVTIKKGEIRARILGIVTPHLENRISPHREEAEKGLQRIGSEKVYRELVHMIFKYQIE